MPALPSAPLERAACLALLAFAAALQLSIAAADILLTIATLLWLGLLVRNHERVEVPKMFWPLAAYGVATLVASVFSVDPRVSLIDSKQLVLLVIVPLDLPAVPRPARAARGGRRDHHRRAQRDVGHRPVPDPELRSPRAAAAGRARALHDLLGAADAGRLRGGVARDVREASPRVGGAGAAGARCSRWRFTFTRSAWVGACVGIGLLFLLRDFRLMGLLPVASAASSSCSRPAGLTARLYSTFSLTDPSNVDRVAMMKSGFHIIKDDPLTGVGPDMIIQVYPHYRDKSAVNQLNPHLHNVPLQIAAERGLPALAVWIWFIVTLVRDFLRRRRADFPSLSNAGIAVIGAMLAAGLFEYNFGDSEFLMLFLVLVTLPYAAERAPAPAASGVPMAGATDLRTLLDRARGQ